MGIGSRSREVFDEREVIFYTSSSETEQNELRMVGVCLGAVTDGCRPSYVRPPVMTAPGLGWIGFTLGERGRGK